MLGNDIVDFSCDEQKYINTRFLKRVLSPTEASYLAKSKLPNAYLWSLWAAKEAGFKAMQKTALQTIFSPSQFKLSPNTLESLLHHDFKQPFKAELIHNKQTIHVLFNWPDETTVHCVAYMGDVTLSEQIQISICQHWDNQLEQNQSIQVRAMAKKLLQQNHIKAEIKRPTITMPDYSKPGPPLLIDQNNQELPHEISLSHDGQWLAVALLCR
jgi:phosphopantetheine--protein transferase-like protein